VKSKHSNIPSLTAARLRTLRKPPSAPPPAGAARLRISQDETGHKAPQVATPNAPEPTGHLHFRLRELLHELKQLADGFLAPRRRSPDVRFLFKHRAETLLDEMARIAGSKAGGSIRVFHAELLGALQTGRDADIPGIIDRAVEQLGRLRQASAPPAIQPSSIDPSSTSSRVEQENMQASQNAMSDLDLALQTSQFTKLEALANLSNQKHRKLRSSAGPSLRIRPRSAD
jgi:hypothetical protein